MELETTNQTEQLEDNQTFPKADLHQKVTDTIIRQLEQGTVPWQKPWVGGDNMFMRIPKNHFSGKKYRGINILLLWAATQEKHLTTNEWASFKQWKEKGESIRKNEKGSMIVYYDTFEKEEEGEIKKIPFLKYSIVFNRAQLTGYKPNQEVPASNTSSLVQRIENVESFVFNTRAKVEEFDHAGYSESKDTIYMPPRDKFIDTPTCDATEGYYSSLFHELTHWTGSEKRLNRKHGKRFGDSVYAQEELVAELGAAFLTSEFGINNLEKGDHASYIANWLEVLKNNKYAIIAAASDASKACDYLNALQPMPE